MKELVVISGKGGTGKTSITAALAGLAKNSVFVDCDVDASDLHLILNPTIKKTVQFKAGYEYYIDNEKCNECGICKKVCEFDAVIEKENKFVIDEMKCESCGVCSHFCPFDAVHKKDNICGQWYVSESRFGPFVHAALGIGEENSGKLVSEIKTEARKIAQENGNDFLIVDGSPGIGCPVIASVSGASLALIVVEPTVSGLHDLERVIKLLNHFKIKGMICINKCDLNEEMSGKITKFAAENDMEIAAEIPYDEKFTSAQIDSKTIIEVSAPSAKNIKELWNNILKKINQEKK